MFGVIPIYLDTLIFIVQRISDCVQTYNNVGYNMVCETGVLHFNIPLY